VNPNASRHCPQFIDRVERIAAQICPASMNYVFPTANNATFDDHRL